MAASLGAAIVFGGGAATCGAPQASSRGAPAAPARGASTTSPARSPLTFERVVSPFPVIDEHGTPYDLPFLGGLDVPRPQFTDIDGDGDYDLFLQEYTDQLWFFENTGTPKIAKYEWRSNRYQDISIGEWFRFHDIDGDGDPDLISEKPFSYISVHRNIGTARVPQFSASDSLRASDGTALFMDRQNIPAFADVDCDGKVDFFVGRVEGTVTHYEAIAPGSISFEWQGDQYQDIVVVGQIDSVGTRHGANALALADFEGDGDIDLFWGDYFERGALLIENISSTCGSPTYVHQVPLPWMDSRTSGYNVPAPVDLDHDGDLDFLMGVLGGAFNPFLTATNNFYYWERTAPKAFTFRTSRFLNGIDIGSESAPAIVDIDGDGDFDIVIGNKLEPSVSQSGRLHVMLNEGTRTAPRYRMTDTLALAVAFHQKPAFGDLDGDGDQDMLLGTWNQDVLYFRNEGTRTSARFVQDTSRTIHPNRVTNAVPALADLDADGDLDLLIGEANGEVNYFRNDGTTRDARFVSVSDKLDDIDVGRSSSPAVVDIDGDGLPDLVVGRESSGVAAFHNVGTKSAPRFVEYPAFTLQLPPMATPTFADIDGDGTPDLISGGASGGLLFFKGR
ncbi:MAG: VCBS repeat-containing protein [Longimicrobiales bacterium]